MLADTVRLAANISRGAEVRARSEDHTARREGMARRAGLSAQRFGVALSLIMFSIVALRLPCRHRTGTLGQAASLKADAVEPDRLRLVRTLSWPSGTMSGSFRCAGSSAGLRANCVIAAEAYIVSGADRAEVLRTAAEG